MPATTTINGDMFSIVVDGPHATIRIWRRPDLDSSAGAENAARIAEEAARLPRSVRGVLLDVKEAPPVSGPKTLASLGAMIAAWAATHVRVAVLVNDDPIKVLQYKRLVTENAPHEGRVLTDALEADAWLAAPKDRR